MREVFLRRSDIQRKLNGQIVLPVIPLSSTLFKITIHYLSFSLLLNLTHSQELISNHLIAKKSFPGYRKGSVRYLKRMVSPTVLPDAIRSVTDQPIISVKVDLQSDLEIFLFCRVVYRHIFIHFLGRRHGNHQVIQHGAGSGR